MRGQWHSHSLKGRRNVSSVPKVVFIRFEGFLKCSLSTRKACRLSPIGEPLLEVCEKCGLFYMGLGLKGESIFRVLNKVDNLIEVL